MGNHRGTIRIILDACCYAVRFIGMRTIVRFILTAFILLLWHGAAYSQPCAPGHPDIVKMLPPVSVHDVLRGDGGLGSHLTNITVTVREGYKIIPRHNGDRPCEHYVEADLEFNIYNHWQRGPHGNGHAVITVHLLTPGGARLYPTNFPPIAFDWPASFCGPYDKPQGVRLRYPGWKLEQVFAPHTTDLIASIEVTSTRITGRIGRC